MSDIDGSFLLKQQDEQFSPSSKFREKDRAIASQPSPFNQMFDS